MIDPEVIAEAERLLVEARLSQRKIATRLGISRGTVNALALGRRRVRPPRPPSPQRDFVPPAGLPVRCHGCGGKVQMPCLLCYVRGLIAAEGRTTDRASTKSSRAERGNGRA